MAETYSFGEWVKQRRNALDLTQRQLGIEASCSVATIKKIESDERRPSRELAGSLVDALRVPANWREAFIESARGIRPVDRLPSPDEWEARADGDRGRHPAEVTDEASLPTGTVTFLFTDIEGSTRLWEEQPALMRPALALHDEILQRIMTRYSGVLVKTTGDGMHAVFRSAPDAAQAAVAGQQALVVEPWDSRLEELRVRMALHTGTAEVRDGDYYGSDVNRAARLLAAGHGGQILLSQATANLVRRHLPSGSDLKTLGRFQLRDLAGVEEIYQLSGTGLPTEFPALNVTRAGQTELPSQATSFIGREQELGEITALLARGDVRLVTLVGPGGMGKTRLAVEAARTQSAGFPDGVYFISLTAVTRSEMVPVAIAESLHLALAGPAEEQVTGYLRARRVLLVLDNCEQIEDGVTWLSQLLQQAPGVKQLATSRERLQLAEEWVYQVPALVEAQAMDLFAQAAGRAKAGFGLEGQEAAVAAVCRLVEHLPLAVELAAGWTPFMSCTQIGDHIRQDLDLLETDLRNVPERHRSLRAVFDYSWRLLTEAEQETLMRLSVFRGGWTAGEAISVAKATLPRLRALVNKSLVRIGEDGRYDLHELTRQYAAVKLRESGRENETCDQHLLTYLSRAEQLNIQINGPEDIAAFAQMDDEHDNFRAALAWGIESRQIDLALRLGEHLFQFWLRRGHWREAEKWLADAVAQAGDGDDPDLSIALIRLGTFIAVQGRYQEAVPFGPRGLAMARRLEEPWPLAVALNMLGQASPDGEAASAAYEEAIAIVQEEGEDNDVWRGFLASLYGLYAERLRDSGRNVEAADKLRRAQTIQEELGAMDMIAYPIGNLGLLALQEGRMDEAYERIRESVTISRNGGNRVGIGDWLLRLGIVHIYRGELEEAERCLQEALTCYEEIGNRPGAARVRACLAQVAVENGEIGLAADLVRNYLRTLQKMTDLIPHVFESQRLTVAADVIDSLWYVGIVKAAQGEHEQAVTLLGGVAAMQARTGYEPPPPLQAIVDEVLSAEKKDLPGEVFNAAWDRGQRMTIEQFLVLALEDD